MPPTLREATSTETVINTFIRKYVHARIGGYVSGRAGRQAEKKGARSRGGGTLREKLTHVVKMKASSHKSKSRKKLKLD